MPTAADIIARVRLDGSRVPGDRKKVESEMRKLVRSFGTSSGTDPLINMIGRLGPAAAASLGSIKLLGVGLEAFNTNASLQAAKMRGDIDAAVKAEKQLNDFVRGIPIVGELGAQIREAATGEQKELDALEYENKQREKANDTLAAKAQLIDKSTKAARALAKEENREIQMMNRSPRRRAIMQATWALEDYKEELEDVLTATGRAINPAQQAAIDALTNKIEALKKKHSPAEFTDAVSAARAVQIAILNDQVDAGQKRVKAVADEEAKKKKIRQDASKPVDARAQARERVAQANERLRQLEAHPRSNDPAWQRARREALEEKRIQGDIARHGSRTAAGTHRMSLRDIQALRNRQRRQRDELRARQEAERAEAGGALARDPSNSLLQRSTRTRMAELDSRQRAEREKLARRQDDERKAVEQRTAWRERTRAGERRYEEERRSRPVDRERRELREGLNSLGGRGSKTDDLDAPRRGDKGGKAAENLGTAAEKLDKAAEKLANAETVGVIER